MLALKFVEAVILLYTPDPNGLSEPPPEGNKILLRILGSVGFFFFFMLRSSSVCLKDKGMLFEFVNTVQLEKMVLAKTTC